MVTGRIEEAGDMTAGNPGLLGVAALTGVAHLRAESLIPTCREAIDTAVEVLDQYLVQYRAHRLFPDHHLLAAHIAQIEALGDVHDLQLAGPHQDLRPKGGDIEK